MFDAILEAVRLVAIVVFVGAAIYYERKNNLQRATHCMAWAIFCAV